MDALPADLMSVNEAAALRGVRTGTVYRLIHAGTLPHYRVGHLYLVRRADTASVYIRPRGRPLKPVIVPDNPPI